MPIANSKAAAANIAGSNRRWRSVLPNRINPTSIAARVKFQSANCGTVHHFGLFDGGAAPRAVVLMESVVVAAAAPGITLNGVNVAVAAVGNPEAENVIAFVNPPGPGVTVIVNDAICPAVTATGTVGPLSEKSPSIVNVCVELSPPPGPAVKTRTGIEAALLSRFEGTGTVNEVELQAVGISTVEPKLTTDSDGPATQTKLAPMAVRGNVALPMGT